MGRGKMCLEVFSVKKKHSGWMWLHRSVEKFLFFFIYFPLKCVSIHILELISEIYNFELCHSLSLW